jgi:hypothetical protein
MKHLAFLAVLLASTAAFAQTGPAVTPMPGAPIAPAMNQDDAVMFARHGVGSVPPGYAHPGMLGAFLNESDVVPVTAFAITPADNVSLLFLNPAGTLATGAITFPAHPGSGQEFCWLSSQTQSAVTMTANTGQTVVGTAVTAGTAGISYCWRYIAATSTWYRVQ